MQTLLEEVEIVVHSFAAPGRKFENLHTGPDRLDIAESSLPVEFNRRGQIHFCNHSHIGAVKNCRILERLILAFGYRKKHKPKILTQIVGRRTYQVPHIFDEKEIELIEIPLLQRLLDHGGFQVTQRTGSNLFYRRLAARQADRVVLRREVSDERGDAVILTKKRECLLQEHRLA